MQTDFHHGATYALARIAGFPRAAAEIIAYSAQYVDDATNTGLVRFQNGALYERFATAHRMLDYRNFRELANHRVWVPFHFLPGNCGLPAGEDPDGEFAEKLVCKPNSPVALDMVSAAICGRHEPYALHRLGITMHVYADTWAHAGFSGLSHAHNEVSDVYTADGRLDERLMERLKGYFVGEALPLGHGPVLSYPDRPWLVWAYTDGRQRRIYRDNPAIYLEAAEHVLVALRRYLAGDPSAAVPGLSSRDRDVLHTLIVQCRDPDERARHASWLSAIGDGSFSFGADPGLTYTAKGVGSWKYAALSTEREVDAEQEVYPFHTGFLSSDWKRFHDAAQVHRLHLITTILPRYGICAA